MSSTSRVRNGHYTEADILAIYLKYREEKVGPFTREVGDFIAHNKRDKGATLEATAFMFSQFAFSQTYQGKQKQTLLPQGKCCWWLRHYLLTKLDLDKEKNVRKALGITKKEALKNIKSWFGEKSIYPTTIGCNDHNLLFSVANFCSRTIVSKNIFDISQVRSELAHIFKCEGIDNCEFDRFVVGTATLLNGKSVEIVPGFKANICLKVENTRHIFVDENGMATADIEPQFVKLLPDGDLRISISTDNQTSDGLVNVELSFLDTEIDTEGFFSRNIVTIDQHRIPRLNLKQEFSFETSRTLPAFIRGN